MRFFVTTAMITIIFLIISISYRFDLWNQSELPYDDEQVGLDDQIIINFSHVVAENTPKGLAVNKFAELVKNKSNGKILVQIYPNGILYNDVNELDALKKGDIQMIAPTFSKMTNKIPSWQVLDLPFLFENDEQVYNVLHSDFSKVLLSELDKLDIHGLTFWHNGFKQLASTKTPLLDIKSFNGLTIRIMPSKVLQKQYTLLNAKPIVTTFNDLYSVIQQNEFLAQENTLSNLYSKGYYSMQPHITLSNHGILAYSVMMDKQFWNSLSKSQQNIIEDSLVEMQRWQHDEAVKLNSQNLQQLKDTEVVQLYTLSEQQRNQLKEMMQPTYNYYEQQTNSKYLNQLRKEIHKPNDLTK